MKKVSVTTTILAMAFVGLTVLSCEDGKKEATTDAQPEAKATEASIASNDQSDGASQVIADYMALKDALVATDEGAAAKAGKQLENTLKSFDVSSYTPEQQKELKDIIEVATEHAEHISRSDVAHQREHFQMLTKDITDMVAITGTENTLYEQFCPMYEDDGGAWLSMNKEIRNPYFGDKMLKCGEVKREIN